MNEDETFPRGTPEAVRIQANGPALFYTYPDQDSSIPKGYRRVVTETYLEPYTVPEEEAEQFVADFYAVDAETARKFFNDEIEAYMRLQEQQTLEQDT